MNVCDFYSENLLTTLLHRVYFFQWLYFVLSFTTFTIFFQSFFANFAYFWFTGVYKLACRFVFKVLFMVFEGNKRLSFSGGIDAIR